MLNPFALKKTGLIKFLATLKENPNPLEERRNDLGEKLKFSIKYKINIAKVWKTFTAAVQVYCVTPHHYVYIRKAFSEKVFLENITLKANCISAN